MTRILGVFSFRFARQFERPITAGIPSSGFITLRPRRFLVQDYVRSPLLILSLRYYLFLRNLICEKSAPGIGRLCEK